MKKVQGIIFSNMHEEVLNEMTTSRCMGSIPFGGRYRLIDFALSNFANSEIEKVGVITRNHYQSLMDHIGSGRDWDLARKNDGLTIWPPMANTEAMSEGKTERIRALGNVMNYLTVPSTEYVLIVFGDLVANIDFSAFIEAHIEKGAKMSVMYKKMEVPKASEASYAQYVLDIEEDGMARGIRLNPKVEGTQNLFLNIILMNVNYCEEQVKDCISRDKFSLGHDIIMPAVDRGEVFTYEFDGYASRFSSMKSYFQANMALLEPEVRESLFPSSRPIYTRVRDEAPVRYGENNKVKNSLLADGCYIDGEVENSIIFRGVTIEKGAKVKDCVLMKGTYVGENSSLCNVITDRSVKVSANQNLMGSPNYPIYISKNSVV